MSTITIRCPDSTLGELLRKESRKRGESINKIVMMCTLSPMPTTSRKEGNICETRVIDRI